MRFSLAALLALAPAALAATSTVSFDPIYDDKTLSTNLITWPRVGGASAIAAFNSPNCGTCWDLTFNGTTVTITAIDHAVGFNIAEAAMNQLTNNQAEQLGRVNAQFVQVANSKCGL